MLTAFLILPAITHDFERIEFDLNGDGVVDFVATSHTAANIAVTFPAGLSTFRVTVKARDVNMNLVTLYTTEECEEFKHARTNE